MQVNNHNCKVINTIVIINNYQINSSSYVTCITLSEGEQVITHIRECHEDLNQYTHLAGGKPNQHDMRASMGRPRLTTFRNDAIRSVRIPPLPSVRLTHDISHWTICGWSVHYLGVHL
jgi:hypothetical protein